MEHRLDRLSQNGGISFSKMRQELLKKKTHKKHKKKKKTAKKRKARKPKRQNKKNLCTCHKHMRSTDPTDKTPTSKGYCSQCLPEHTIHLGENKKLYEVQDDKWDLLRL